MAMKKFQCPKCKAVVNAIGSEVAHRCPSNKSKLTGFIIVDKAPITKDE
jgi:phage FluMu protein Com